MNEARGTTFGEAAAMFLLSVGAFVISAQIAMAVPGLEFLPMIVTFVVIGAVLWSLRTSPNGGLSEDD